MPLPELELIRRIRQRQARVPQVRARRSGANLGEAGHGIGDDCAVLPIPRGHAAPRHHRLLSRRHPLPSRLASRRRRRTPLPRPRTQRHRRHGRHSPLRLPLARAPRRPPAKMGRRLPPRLPQARAPIQRSTRRRRHRPIPQRHPRRHHRRRQRSLRQSHPPLRRAPRRHPLRHRNPRRFRRHSAKRFATARSPNPTSISATSIPTRVSPSASISAKRNSPPP